MKKTKLERASLCVECGPNVRVDEDGCCAACGASAMGPWADKAVAALKARTPSAVQRAERAVVRAAVRFAAHPGVHTVTDAALVRTVEQARKAEAEAKFGAGLAQDLSGELDRLRERDARVREVLEHVSTHLGVATAGIAPAATARAALDISPSLVREAIALLKETP